MCRRLIQAAVAPTFLSVVLGLTLMQFARGQQTTTTTQTTVSTQTTQAVQNADGSWTVVQYPADREVVVDLTPAADLSGMTGQARVTRKTEYTEIRLTLAGIRYELLIDREGREYLGRKVSDRQFKTCNERMLAIQDGYQVKETSEKCPGAPVIRALNLYAVDPLGKVTMLGPLNLSDNTVRQNFITPLDRFMLVLSPDDNLTRFSPTAKVAFRSAVPQGFAVVPLAGEIGERVAATSTAGWTTTYTAPMLGIPSYQRGSTSEVKVKLSGALTGSRVNFNIEPRKDGPTTIVARFHELKEAPAGQVYVLWAVSPDNKYVKLGQIVNTGVRNEAEIKSETTLPDFGLFITLESDLSTPTGVVVGTVIP
jgi:hypothetical protein